jgi:hypothetical protein
MSLQVVVAVMTSTYIVFLTLLVLLTCSFARTIQHCNRKEGRLQYMLSERMRPPSPTQCLQEESIVEEVVL